MLQLLRPLAPAPPSLPLALLLGAAPQLRGEEQCAQSEDGSCRAAPPQRVAVVTGANRGIGLDVVSGLLSRLPSDFDVVLTGRRPDAVETALRCLRQRHYAEGEGTTCCEGKNAGRQSCEFGTFFYEAEGAGPRRNPAGRDRLRGFVLDLKSSTSVSELGAYLREEYGRVDILVNNGAAPSSAGPQEHLAVDHFGHLALFHEVEPLLQPGARIVHVGSQSGALRGFSPELRGMLLDDELTEEALDALLQGYLALAAEGRQGEAGWPRGSGYAVAKAANGATARIQARDLRRRFGQEGDVLVNACCPGPANAPHTQKGAHVVIHLATLPAGDSRTGRWFVDRGWTGQPWEAEW